ncbi:hypothetical protein BFW01_g2492 [Lasiodiplodia theobromae]|uniref:Uncharacterized protein n=1 Tax=Lasiodiplodia theobromae TaxID=45133 RepID=A0A5N5DQ42_9PEZI|nr:uncharacterized protein LTHEOB_5388 [Lasiodiplodia theobromae]KAB2580049.1 hypothetical protein DBV05_g1357 [Lasiodiplodia theobromae]KAF4544977.1 hypothetical protein LTHEOB_5388 [Lasiodiplodia theobromae]KAF9631630.1 hypothetical protein BFW01_g2492 [Lasiodiplodia theobromae]
MAPDLNSVPPSPRLPQASATATHPSAPTPSNGSNHQTPPASTSHPSSRRASQLSSMNPPPLPLGAAAANGSAPTSQPQSQATYQPFPPLSPHLPGTAPRGSLDEAGVPMRHPRPLTAAELHHELELEQEAVVNRLTRELSALRAHSASVASSVSSTSTSAHPHSSNAFLFEATDPSAVHAGALTGPTHPTASRRHRSSSSVSRASQPHRWSVSSQNQGQGQAPPLQQTDGAGSGVISGASSTYAAGVGMARSPSLGVGTSAAARFEEAALHRQELEEAKKENELLRKRIRDLEAELRGRRSSGGPPATASPREISQSRSSQREDATTS